MTTDGPLGDSAVCNTTGPSVDWSRDGAGVTATGAIGVSRSNATPVNGGASN
jgi:hypothetical protein